MVMSPTLKNTSFGSPRSSAATVLPMSPTGTAISTATGTLQLSYSAARHRYTTRMDSANSSGACAPEISSCSDCPAQSLPKPRGRRWVTIACIACMACPELRPGALPPVISTAG